VSLKKVVEAEGSVNTSIADGANVDMDITGSDRDFIRSINTMHQEYSGDYWIWD
jgi:hypothetical protein